MRAVDLFAGCGGLSLGLQQSGIDIIAAYENWEPAIGIYKNNFTHPVYPFDLSDVEGAIAHISKQKPDMISGGPPCQDFSSAGYRNENGGNADLTIAYAKIVAGVRPTWFIMENVDRILKTKIFEQAKQIFIEAGYGLTEVVLDASLCGVPQKRKRMFLIGKRRVKNDFAKTAIETALANKSMTVRDYFGDGLNTQFYYRHARSYARRGVFSIDEPSPTIRGVNRPIPPDYKPHKGDATLELSKVRPLTSYERAAIQTFPSTFKWEGPNKSTLEQIIGNAVPVNLARFVGTAIMNYQRSKQRKKSNGRSVH
jgi:DNA (cytosine-5)-methyltransferase 1